MEGCFTFQWGGGGFVFQMGVALFLNEGSAPWGASVLMVRGVLKKIERCGPPHAPPPTMGNPVKQHPS